MPNKGYRKHTHFECLLYFFYSEARVKFIYGGEEVRHPHVDRDAINTSTAELQQIHKQVSSFFDEVAQDGRRQQRSRLLDKRFDQ